MSHRLKAALLTDHGLTPRPTQVFRTKQPKVSRTKRPLDWDPSDSDDEMEQECNSQFPTTPETSFSTKLHPTLRFSQPHKLRPQPRRLALPSPGGNPTTRSILLARLRQEIGLMIQSRWSKSTIQRRLYLGTTYTHFLSTMNLPETEESLILALQWMSKSVAASTLAGYATTLRAMYPGCGGQSMTDYIAALRIRAGSDPLRQAPPISFEQFHESFMKMPLDVRWAFWLTWKTASRWADVKSISGKMLHFTDRLDEVVVDFRNLTKASKNRPFRHDMIVMVRDTPTNVQALRRYVLSRPTTAPLTTWTTTQLTAFLRKLFPNSNLSAHSLKRKVVQLLMDAAAEGLIPLQLVAQMAKHVGGVPLLPDTTVRYLTDRIALARANHSGDATKLIPS